MQQAPEKTLRDKVIVVAGATRGAGRGIALMLGEAGATVYVTGRSIRGQAATQGRPETIEETAEMVTALGGKGIAVRVDHTIEDEVKVLFEHVKQEQNGHLDVLVNDVWGGDELTQWDKPFWEHSLSDGLLMQRRAVHSHIITSYYGVPLMIARSRGLVIEVTDGTDYRYRGNFFYSLAKISAIHLAEAMAEDLHKYNITALAVTPGYLRSEAMLDRFGVTEANWQDAVRQDKHFIASETPFYIGRAIRALVSDAHVAAKSGKTLASWDLASEYNFTDKDGRQPSWGKYFAENVTNTLEL
jgi:NAD(P)-dependent dehydrogenase (short-subunit alcohol dehydrogenase family)